MEIPIDVSAIWQGFLTAMVMAMIGSAAAFVWRLWQVPKIAQESLEEMRLLRASIERLIDEQLERERVNHRPRVHSG